MAERVTIFDTTLRDGEQAPGISLDVPEKLEIAEQLARLGVDVIEAGFPVASQGDFEAVQAVAAAVRGPVIAGLSRTQLADVDRCWEAVRGAERARIHVFISTSPSHMEHMLKMTPEQVVAETRSGVGRAREHTDDVEFSPQDATRTPLEFMLEVLQAAVDAGATTLNIPDTVGYGIPWDFGALIQYVRREVKVATTSASTHCHNDLGLAVANSLAGIENGARQVEVAVNGIGERAGNAALEEIVMALKVRRDRLEYETAVNTPEIYRASQLLSHLTGVPAAQQGHRGPQRLRPRKPGSISTACWPSAGRPTRSSTPPVGQTGRQDLLGKHSGRHRLPDTLQKMGIEIHGDAPNAALTRFTELADRKVGDHRSRPRGDRGRGAGHEGGAGVHPEASRSRAGPSVCRGREAVLGRGGEKLEASAEGDGMIDAACQAIRAA